MNSGGMLIAIGVLFSLVNYYWHNKIYQKKVELEEKERAILKKERLNGEADVYGRLVSILESINDGLGEWQGIEPVHCPDELQSFKKAQEEIEELIHDREVLE